MPNETGLDATREWILAIRLRQFGDVLAALEPLRALKAADPDRAIAYVVDEMFHPVLRDLDFIDRLLPQPPRLGRGLRAYARYISEIRRLRPAATIDFHGNARSAIVTLLSGAPLRIGYEVRGRRYAYNVVEPRGVRENGRYVPRSSIASGAALVRHAGAVDALEAPPEIPVAAEVVERARNALAEAGVSVQALAERRVTGINPGKPYPAKAWPVDRFVDLARRLARDGREVVVMWGPGEEEVARDIARESGGGVTLAPDFDLVSLCGVLKCLDKLVTIDSGLKHLAVCLRVPTLSLFGATDPREWHLGTPADRYLWKGLSCSPCRLLDCPFGAPCMDHDTDTVLETLVAMEGSRS